MPGWSARSGCMSQWKPVRQQQSLEVENGSGGAQVVRRSGYGNQNKQRCSIGMEAVGQPGCGGQGELRRSLGVEKVESPLALPNADATRASPREVSYEVEGGAGATPRGQRHSWVGKNTAG
eukprot:350066-Chlamydomonas_euryale.AAC.5